MQIKMKNSISFVFVGALLSISACRNSTEKNDLALKPCLSANREAPVGWVNFDAYPDSTFTYSLSPRDKHAGTYSQKGDTLFLTCADSSMGVEMVVVEENSLHFIGKQTPLYAGITINSLTK